MERTEGQWSVWQLSDDEIASVMDAVETAPQDTQVNLMRMLCVSAPCIIPHPRAIDWVARNAQAICRATATKYVGKGS